MPASDTGGGSGAVRNILKIAAFAGILAVILAVLSATVFDGASWFLRGWIINRNARVAAVEAEDEGTLDVIAVGNSLCVSGFTPLELWEKYGITSFNCAQDGENPVECYYVLQKILRRQKPRICLIETDMFYQGANDQRLREIALKMPIQNLFPMIRYHTVWMTPLSVKPFRVYYKGYLINGVTDAYTGGEYYFPTDERKEIKPVYLRYFRKMIRMCREKGVVPVLFSAPSPDNYTMARHNTIEDLALELDIPYIDLNMNDLPAGIDWENDTRDGGIHMNQNGAEKMTLCLGEWITSNYTVSDHRGEAAFAGWDDLILSYRVMIEEMRGTCYTEMEDALGIEYW